MGSKDWHHRKVSVFSSVSLESSRKLVVKYEKEKFTINKSELGQLLLFIVTYFSDVIFAEEKEPTMSLAKS